MCPVEGGWFQCLHRRCAILPHQLGTISECIAGYSHSGGFRLLIEIHNLRHRRRHTTRIGQFVAIGLIVGVHELRTFVPIRRRLVPLRRDEGCDGVVGAYPVASRSTQNTSGLCVVHLCKHIELLGIAVEPVAHVRRHTACIERPLVAIAEDRVCAVVARHDDKSLLVADVDDVERRLLSHREGRRDVREPDGFSCLRLPVGLVVNRQRVVFQKRGSLLHGLLLVDGASHGDERYEQTQYYEKSSHCYVCFLIILS